MTDQSYYTLADPLFANMTERSC